MSGSCFCYYCYDIVEKFCKIADQNYFCARNCYKSFRQKKYTGDPRNITVFKNTVIFHKRYLQCSLMLLEFTGL